MAWMMTGLAMPTSLFQSPIRARKSATSSGHWFARVVPGVAVDRDFVEDLLAGDPLREV